MNISKCHVGDKVYTEQSVESWDWTHFVDSAVWIDEQNLHAEFASKHMTYMQCRQSIVELHVESPVIARLNMHTPVISPGDQDPRETFSIN